MFRLDAVSKSFGSKKALSSVSVAGKKGEIIGFLGPNGAGKTTTMRTLLGYLAPSAGSVSVFGSDPLKNRESILTRVGYLPESNPLYTEMKVCEYLSFIAQVHGTSKWENIALEVGLEDALDSKIETLSRGYKQRVGLAAALIGTPDLLILDEPTSGLDPIEQDRIKAFIKKIAKNKTVIFSTHMLSEVEEIATRLVIISRGKIVYDGKKPAGRGGVEKLFKKVVKE